MQNLFTVALNERNLKCCKLYKSTKKVIFADLKLKLNVLTFLGFLPKCVQHSQNNIPVQYYNKPSNFTSTIKLNWMFQGIIHNNELTSKN